MEWRIGSLLRPMRETMEAMHLAQPLCSLVLRIRLEHTLSRSLYVVSVGEGPSYQSIAVEPLNTLCLGLYPYMYSLGTR